MPDPMSPQELLDEPPFEESLEEALAAHPPRARLPMVTLCLGAGVVAVAGFIGGVHADKAWGGGDDDVPSIAQDQGRRGFPGQGVRPGRQDQGGPGQGGFPGGGGLTSGTVGKVSGDTVEVKTADGRTVKVTVGDQTRVTVSKEGAVEDLKPGAAVTVRGDQITVTAAR
ncbi:hypothetical protein ABGB12_16705 [Actinocorallia sp. B10E7]|uniref:hypothetical protein n=1 Tax=Actinocorallia sp. B10E7 TaxID=3153558 RepID=UPI00325CF3B7